MGIPEEWLAAYNAKLAEMGVQVQQYVPMPPQGRPLPHAGRNQSAMAAHAKGVPNATEQRFYDEYLAPLFLAGEILMPPVFEPFRAVLAPKTTFAPDWGALTREGYRVWDVKGTRRAPIKRRKRESEEDFARRKATTKGRQVPLVEDDAAVKHKWFRKEFPGIPLGIAFLTDAGWVVRWE